MRKKKRGYNRRAKYLQDSVPSYDIVAIAAAAFDGDAEALSLLQELGDEGDLDAFVYADIAADNGDEVEDGDDGDDGG